MLINFRQGIVSCQLNGLGAPQFLLPSTTDGYVQLVVEPSPTVVAFAHGGSDYLQVFDRNVEAAWGPVITGINNYLYWDIDLLTSDVSYGITLVPPVVQASAPTSPSNDQHWFDISAAQMKVWNAAAGAWQVKVRVFAGTVINGNLSSINHRFIGTQVGLNVEARAGFIILDSQLRAMRNSSNEFLTAESRIHIRTTVGTAGAIATPPSGFLYARASENIPGMSFVYFSGPDMVGAASSDLSLPTPRIPIGLIQQQLTSGEVGVITQFGEITHDGWDWTGDIGRPVYCGVSGEVTTVRPMGFIAYRVGFIKNARTILLDIDVEPSAVIAEVDANVVVQSQLPLVTTYGSPGGVPTYQLTLPAASSLANGYMTIAQATQLNDQGLRLTTAEGDIIALQSSKSDVGHTHVIADVTGLQSALNAKSNVGHNHDDLYSPLGHNHNDLYSLLGHVHTIADITGLTSALAGKTDIGHGHAIADVSGLSTALSSKLDLTGGTLTGALVLSGNPTVSLGAATKQYVDGYAVAVWDEGAVVTNKVATLNFSGPGITTSHVAGITTVQVVEPSTLLIVLSVSGPYTPTIVDEGNGRHLHRVSAAADTQFIVPNDTTLNFPVGSTFLVGWTGVGQVEIAGQAGVTINSPDTNLIGKRHGKVTIIKVAANEWDLEGNLEPAP